RALEKKRKDLKTRYPNLADYEARLAFRHFYAPQPIPPEGTVIDDVDVRKTLLGGIKRVPIRRPIHRSQFRKGVRIGIPRVLNLYSSAPLWRTYFEALGLDETDVVFSDVTSEEMWIEGAK